ncbi:MAG: DUF1573 domain-containing protein [Bacteroidaceae bacterium]|nr:DUF1573 domain-containing protein [Bacteroidaceae bacterium]MBR6925627.1 DUF1573 domain-containing protein [Bacteroidaceae bacterium]MBR7029054.1 DUF1573 domain-containing protein [Bacteroidaceae bacterium]
MKKIFSLLFVLMLTLTASAQAEIKFDKTSHNFGTFAETTPQTVTFTFTNTGDKPLIIQQVFTSCGCTAYDYTKTEIKPGEKGIVTATYNGKGQATGSVKKVITVRSNASNSIVRLYIEGNMVKK